MANTDKLMAKIKQLESTEIKAVPHPLQETINLNQLEVINFDRSPKVNVRKIES